MVCHYRKLGIKSVPPVVSKTSMPQTWHIPQWTLGLSSKPVDTVQINKVQCSSTKEENPKKRRIVEGLLPTTYCPVMKPIPFDDFAYIGC